MLKESASECEQARQIDPLVKGNGAVLNSYLYLGKYDEFLQSLPDVNDSPFLLFYRGFGEYHLKDWKRAAKDFDRAYKLDPTLYTQSERRLLIQSHTTSRTVWIFCISWRARSSKTGWVIRSPLTRSRKATLSWVTKYPPYARCGKLFKTASFPIPIS